METPGSASNRWSLRYSADLDPAGLADPEEGPHLAARAATAMKVGLLLEGRVPVLAQNQVFDSRLLLGWSADATEIEALSWLVRNNYVRMKAYSQRRDSGPPTLSGAFARALRDQRFEFSGWSFESADHRDELARIIVGESRNPVPSGMVKQVDAIRSLDESFRSSSDDEQARDVPHSLSWFIQREVEQRDAGQPRGRVLREKLNSLFALAEEINAGEKRLDMGDAEPLTSVDLNRRSDWRRLIKAKGGLSPDTSSHEYEILRSLEAIVDLAYNSRVAESCGAQLQREVALAPAAREVLTEDPDSAGAYDETSWFVESMEGDEWLTWTRVRELIEEGMGPNPLESRADAGQRRQHTLTALINDKVVATDERGQFLTRVALPTLAGVAGFAGIDGAANFVAADAAFFESLISGGAGAATGAVVARTRVGERLIDWDRDRRVAKQRRAMTAELVARGRC